MNLGGKRLTEIQRELCAELPTLPTGLTPQNSFVLEESSRKTEELKQETPQGSPALKRSRNIMMNMRKQSGYFNYNPLADEIDEKPISRTTHIGAKDKLTIVDGCKVIIDIGTYTIKIGLITDDEPRRRLPFYCNSEHICEEALDQTENEGMFVLEPYHIDEFTENEDIKYVIKCILEQIYVQVLRGCSPSNHPIYFTLNLHLLNTIDTIRGCFTELGVNEIEYVNPLKELLLPTESETGLILDFGSAISLKAVIDENLIDQMEVDNPLINYTIPKCSNKIFIPINSIKNMFLFRKV